MLKSIWYWFNATFGLRQYFKGEDGKAYIREGWNKPEELFEHLKVHHPEEYARLDGEELRNELNSN